MTECSNGVEFSDGGSRDSASDGHVACYCTMIDRACVDGRLATLCTNEWERPWLNNGDYLSDGPDPTDELTDSGWVDVARFSDGGVTDFGSGLAQCLGFDYCSTRSPQIGEATCTEGRGFYECSNSSSSTYVNLFGQTFASFDQAVADCRLPAAFVP